MTDNTNRISKLELKTDAFENDIHEINIKVGHIENDMSDIKTISKNNTDSNIKTNETLTDIHLLISEFKGGFKVLLWIIGSVGGFAGIAGIAMAVAKINGG